MAEFKVLRSFGGNTRGSKVNLPQKDAAALLEGDRPYVEAVAKKAPAKKAAPRKQSAKKTTAPEAPAG